VFGVLFLIDFSEEVDVSHYLFVHVASLKIFQTQPIAHRSTTL